MGWYLKKSFVLGPVRLNLSKSGIGASVGVKGLRLSTGPKGRQINAGREGLYYRQSLNSLDSQSPREPQALDELGSAREDEPITKPAAEQPRKQFLADFLKGLFRGR